MAHCSCPAAERRRRCRAFTATERRFRVLKAGLVLYRAFSDIVGKGVFFAITVIAARRLSQDAFGVFSLATTTGWVAAVVADFGLQLHLARLVAQRPADAGATLRLWLAVRLWTAGATVAAVVTGLFVFGASPGVLAALTTFTVVYAVGGLIEFLHYFYRGLARSDIESTLTLWQRLATLVLAGVALTWQPDVVSLGVAMAIPAAATALYSVRRALQLQPSAPDARGVPRLGPVLEALPRILPIGAGIVLSALYFRIDVFLLEAWRGSSDVALYNAVFRLVEALRLFPAAVLAVALPALFRAATWRPLVKLSVWLTAGSLAVVVVLWAAAGRLIPLIYGEPYGAAVPAFRVLLLAFPLMSLNYALTHQLIGWYGHRTYAATCALALAFNVLLNARLIPESGFLGAAWTTVWTEAVLTAGCLFALLRTTASRDFARYAAHPAAGPAEES